MENSDAIVASFSAPGDNNNGIEGNVKEDNNDQSAIKISSCSREQLLEMLAILEAELQARDVTIATLQNEKLRHMLYEAKFGRGCLDDPYLALEHDGAVLGEDLDEDMLMRAAHEAKLVHLENLLVSQHNLVEKIRAHVQLYQTKYSSLYTELEEERNKRLQDASQSEKAALTWESETKKLKDELTYERGCVKTYQEDIALMVSIVEAMRVDITKHKKVALMLIKERKLLAECLLKDRQRLKELEDSALNDDKATIERTVEEKISRITQDRAILEERLRQEESRHKATRAECDRLRAQIDFLQAQLQQQQLQMQVATSQSVARQSSPLTLSTTGESRSSIPAVFSSGSVSSVQRNVVSASSTPSSFTVTSRVPLENAPVIAQRALAPAAVVGSGTSSFSYRSPSTAVSSSPNIIGSSSIQPFQNQINLQQNRSPAVASSPTTAVPAPPPVTPTSALGAGGGPRLSFLPGQSAVLTTSSGQRISLHVSPSKPVTPTVVPSPSAITSSPMVVHVNQGTPQSSSLVPNATNRPASTPSTSIGAIRAGTPIGNQRPIPPTPLSPTGNTPQANSVAVSSSFNITIRPDSKGVSTFIGASSTPPEPPARLGSAGAPIQRSQPNLTSPSTVSTSSPAAYQLDSPTEAGRYLTIKKIGVAATHSLNN